MPPSSPSITHSSWTTTTAGAAWDPHRQRGDLPEVPRRGRDNRGDGLHQGLQLRRPPSLPGAAALLRSGAVGLACAAGDPRVAHVPGRITCVRRRDRHRQLRRRRRPSAAAGPLDRRAALGLRFMRHADRRLRQRAGPLLAAAARPLPQLRRARSPRATRWSSSRSALSFAATAVVFGDDPAELALGLLFVAILAAITLTDLERRVIPNVILLAGASQDSRSSSRPIPRACRTALSRPPRPADSLLGSALAYPRGMGMGDVKLAAVMGLFLGRAVAPALLIAVLAGALVGAGVMLRHGTGARKAAVPFGPFLALGGVVALLVGTRAHRLVPERLRSLGERFISLGYARRPVRPMGEEARSALPMISGLSTRRRQLRRPRHRVRQHRRHRGSERRGGRPDGDRPAPAGRREGGRGRRP